jgi:hypothetical protein
MAPELADPVGPIEVREHEDMEKLGAGSGTEGVETIALDSLDVVQVHERERLHPDGSSSSAERSRPDQTTRYISSHAFAART